MRRLKDYIFPLIVLFFFAGYFTNTVIRSGEIVSFINQGARNTAQQGHMLCMRINTLEILNELHPSDCDNIYK